MNPTILRQLVLLPFVLLIYFSSRAQEVPFFEQYDSVIYQKVQVNGVFMRSTKKELVLKLGMPAKITRFESDATDDHWMEYHYGRDILQVLDDGRVCGFELRTPAFAWQYGDVRVKVGDPVSGVCPLFPASCRTMKETKGEVLRVRCQGTDGFVHFHVKNNRIIDIQPWQDL